jgi:hypothetical protein
MVVEKSAAFFPLKMSTDVKKSIAFFSHFLPIKILDFYRQSNGTHIH